MKTKLLGVVAVFTLFATSLIGPVNADTITWNVSLTLGDGEPASGSFTIDPSTLVIPSLFITFPSVDITTTWRHYTSDASVNLYDSRHVAFSLPAFDAALQLFLNSGSLLIAAPLISVRVLENNGDPIGGTDVRDGFGTISASVAAPVVPLPGALPLFATGLGALGLLGWRRKRKATLAFKG